MAARSGSLFGDGGADALRGGAGNDILMGGAGEDSIDGGSGYDAALFTGAFADYTINLASDSIHFTGANGETDVVRHVEQVRFLGNGETYSVNNGALALTADAGDLNDRLPIISLSTWSPMVRAVATRTSLRSPASASCCRRSGRARAPMDMGMGMGGMRWGAGVADVAAQQHDLLAA